MTNWQTMFVAKVSYKSGRVFTMRQRTRESFNDFVTRVERIVEGKDATIQVREVVKSGVGE